MRAVLYVVIALLMVLVSGWVGFWTGFGKATMLDVQAGYIRDLHDQALRKSQLAQFERDVERAKERSRGLISAVDETLRLTKPGEVTWSELMALSFNPETLIALWRVRDAEWSKVGDVEAAAGVAPVKPARP